MKKLLNTQLLIISLTFVGCNFSAINTVDKGIKVVTGCCKNVIELKNKGCGLVNPNTTFPENELTSKSLLPTYSWDAKQMLW